MHRPSAIATLDAAGFIAQTTREVQRMTARDGRSERRPLPDSSEGRNLLSGLPEAWGLAGLLAATPIIGALTGCSSTA